MLSRSEIEAALSLGYEASGLEIKGPGPRTSRELFAKVARGCLSLGNRRDGGHLIIGINDANPEQLLPGLMPDDLASWTYDDVARTLREYADPPIRFELATRTLSSEAAVVVLEVLEFEDTPHFCDRTFGDGDVLQEGELYVRPRGVPETSRIARAVDMRDLIELAAEKRLRRYLEMADRAGVTLSVEPRETDDDRYGAELERGWE